MFLRAWTVFTVVLGMLALFATAAFAAETGGQPAPSPTGATPPRPGPPASYYASYGLVALAGLTIIAIIAGYLFQAPGFRRQSRGASAE